MRVLLFAVLSGFSIACARPASRVVTDVMDAGALDGRVTHASEPRVTGDAPFDGRTDGGRSDSSASRLNEPRILTLNASLRELTIANWEVTISAVVTDPDGIDDLIGGQLYDGSSDVAYGAFSTAAAEGAYSITLSIADIHAVREIATPLGGEERPLRALFFDAAGHSAERTLSLRIGCESPLLAACGGSCTTLTADDDHCGRCANVCTGESPSGRDRCYQGACRFTSHPPPESSCADRCREFGLGCVATELYGKTATIVDDCTPVGDRTCFCSRGAAAPDAGVCEAGAEDSLVRCTDGCSNDGDRYIDCEDRDCCRVLAGSCGPTTYCARA